MTGGLLSRRQVLAGTGALLLGFSLTPGRGLGQEGQNAGTQPPPVPQLPGSLKKEPLIDAWIRIGQERSTDVPPEVAKVAAAASGWEHSRKARTSVVGGTGALVTLATASV